MACISSPCVAQLAVNPDHTPGRITHVVPLVRRNGQLRDIGPGEKIPGWAISVEDASGNPGMTIALNSTVNFVPTDTDNVPETHVGGDAFWLGAPHGWMTARAPNGELLAIPAFRVP